MLRDVGAVDFLTQLSPNVDPRLRAVIDGTLEQLFHLPELLPSHVAFSSNGQHATAPTGVACYSLKRLYSILSSKHIEEYNGMSAVLIKQHVI